MVGAPDRDSDLTKRPSVENLLLLDGDVDGGLVIAEWVLPRLRHGAAGGRWIIWEASGANSIAGSLACARQQGLPCRMLVMCSHATASYSWFLGAVPVVLFKDEEGRIGNENNNLFLVVCCSCRPGAGTGLRGGCEGPVHGILQFLASCS